MMIYDRIKKLCKDKKISVNKLEETLEISKGSLCKIDVNKPSAEKMQKLADFFGVTVEFLATGEESYSIPQELISSAKIKALRIKKGMSQEELSLKLNIPTAHYTEYENGKYSLDKNLMIKIFEILNETIDGVIVEDGDLYLRLVGGNIKSQREKCGISIEDLSMKTEIPVDVIQSFEDETLFPSQRDLEIIAYALNSSPDNLLGLSGYVLADKRTTILTLDSKLDKSERNLLDEFRKLNELGKMVAIERLQELSEVPKYTENN